MLIEVMITHFWTKMENRIKGIKYPRESILDTQNMGNFEVPICKTLGNFY